MTKAAAKFCSKQRNCRCYKCSIINAININQIVDDIAVDIIHCIVSYVPKYVIYAISDHENQYNILPQLTQLIEQFTDIHCIGQHLLIQTQYHDLFLFDMHAPHSTPIQLQFTTSFNSIMSSITNFIAKLFDINEQTEQKHTHKWMMSLGNLDVKFAHYFNYRSRAFIINPITFDLHQIVVKKIFPKQDEKIQIIKMKNIQSTLISFDITKGDKIKKFFHFYASFHMQFWFLFESGRLIKIALKSSTQNVVNAEEYPVIISDIFGPKFVEAVDEHNSQWSLKLDRQFKTHFRRDNVIISNDGQKPVIQVENEHCDVILFGNGACRVMGTLSNEEYNGDYEEYVNFTNLSKDPHSCVYTFQEFDGLSNVKIVDVVIGSSHMIFLDDQGNVYGIGNTCQRQISVKHYDYGSFAKPYKIKKDEINLHESKHKVMKVFACGNKTMFVVNVEDVTM
eukprot:362588_1